VNGKKARAQRQATAPAKRPSPSSSASFWGSPKFGLIALAVVTVIAASFVLPGLLGNKGMASGDHAMAAGVKMGEGLPAGSLVPSFSEKDVVTGQPISSKALYGQRTLLFFSEGVMCQACFQQIKDIEDVGADLARRGIRLVSITPDSSGDLRQVIGQVGIRTPMISDSDRNMSEAFNTLGQGMHGDTPGHAFALISHGKVLWYRDYWLAPSRTMYVKPAELLKDIPA
jgi:peroxiredoxin